MDSTLKKIDFLHLFTIKTACHKISYFKAGVRQEWDRSKRKGRTKITNHEPSIPLYICFTLRDLALRNCRNERTPPLIVSSIPQWLFPSETTQEHRLDIPRFIIALTSSDWWNELRYKRINEQLYIVIFSFLVISFQRCNIECLTHCAVIPNNAASCIDRFRVTVPVYHRENRVDPFCRRF